MVGRAKLPDDRLLITFCETCDHLWTGVCRQPLIQAASGKCMVTGR